MVDEKLRANVIARAKKKVSECKPLTILETITLMEYIKELEAAQQSTQADVNTWTCANCGDIEIPASVNVCGICNTPRH